MPKRLALFSFGLFVFIQFVIFSYLVHKNLFTKMDFDTTVRLQDNISRRVDESFSFLSDIGKFETMFLALIVILVLSRKIWAGIVAVSLFAALHIIELFGKLFINHPPPPEFLLRTKSIIAFPQFHVRSEFAYPSGHSARTLFLSILLVILILQNRKIPVVIKLFCISLIAIYDIVMLLSRVYLGEHWTTDVIGGTFLGLALGLFAGTLLIEKQSSHKA